MSDLEKIINLSKIIAKPWVIATYVLSFLLLVSVVSNVYIFLKGTEVVFTANENMESTITQNNG